MPLSNYSGNKILDHLHGKTAWTMPTGYFIGLFTTNPTSPSNAGTEMSGGSYARTDVHTLFAAAASKSAASNAQIQVTANAGTVTGWGAWDALTTGNLLAYDSLLQSIVAEAQTFATSGSGIEDLKVTHPTEIRNVVVKDSSDVTTYTLHTDYEVEYITGRVIRVTTGTIGSGATVHITYDYPTTQVFANGNIFQINSGGLVDQLTGY